MGQDTVRRLDEYCVLEAIKDHQFGIGHGLGDLSVEARIAAAIEFAGKHHGGGGDLMQPRAHLGFGIDVEDVEENVGRRIHDLALAPRDHIRPGGGELIGEPPRGERIENLSDALFAHGGDDGLDLCRIIISAESRRGPKAQ